MKLKREWQCIKLYDGILMTLSCGDFNACTKISKNDLHSVLDVNKFVEYHILRLNLQLQAYLAPLTRSLHTSIYKTGAF